MKIQEIINGGYCIGCGACSAVSGLGITMQFDKNGQYVPKLAEPFVADKADLEKALDICPFSSTGPNEDAIATQLYGTNARPDNRIGYSEGLYLGHVAEGDFRAIATSGGLITWLLCELLKAKEIDGVIHVKQIKDPADGVLFRYGLSTSIEEIRQGAKSRYYPIELSEVIALLKSRPGRYGFVGLPCFVKAIRRLGLADPEIGGMIKYTFGIVCGHLKSRFFADSFAWQVGIPPGTLEAIDFRVKHPEGSAVDYHVSLKGSGIDVTKRAKDFFGANWGYNFFRYSACDYCDDVFAETADVTVGDAWLPDYSKDPGGNSVVVVRNRILNSMIKRGIDDGRLGMIPTTADKIASSQFGGIRDRREGLAYRLWLKQKAKEAAPKKRVEPSYKHVPLYRRLIYKNRLRLRAESHRQWEIAVQQGNFERFRSGMKRLIFLNHLYYKYPAFIRSIGRNVLLLGQPVRRLFAKRSTTKSNA
jgi:coenzyme F420-reducing hydrogenase beta subunit